MINKEIKKKKISPLIKTNQALNHPKYKKTIAKKKEEQKIQKKVVKKSPEHILYLPLVKESQKKNN